MANLLSLRYVLKIPSAELAKKKWNLTLTREQAIEKEMLVSLASNYLIRSLDEVSNSGFSEEKVVTLKREIRDLTRLKS